MLIGYGYNIFDIPGVLKSRPAALGDAFRFLSPSAGGGGNFLPGSGLMYADDIATNLATEDIALQLIGDTQLAINRPIVEVQTYLRSVSDPAIEVASVYHGFNREDGRSWIGFHDGVSNIPSHQRWKAIEIKTAGWTEGGTYKTFIRLGVNLEAWEQVSVLRQNNVVGRDKNTGCPVTGVDLVGNPVAASGCPVAGSGDIFDPANSNFKEPTAPMLGDIKIIRSHVQRANNAHSTDWASKSSLRVYRQGYEFLETLSTPSRIEVGLNFICFQDHPERIFRVLTQDGWLGATNFGGEINQQNPDIGLRQLLTVRAAGNFLIPPIDLSGELPGKIIFTQ
ncbi:MAG: Dyp-type peroxidase [Pyrinomonadaceae bacterium]|nr:Dyp-type peroxidase [Pyrinomonadaceae bacterium]